MPRARPTPRLAALLTAAVLTLAASVAVAQEFDWRRFEGQTLNVLLVSSSWTTVIEPRVAEFEALTGIDVELQVMPEQQGRQRLLVDFAAGGNTVDVFDSALHNEKPRFTRAGWYEPLDAYLASDLTHPEFDFADFFPANQAAATASDGAIIAFPTKPTAQLFFYRTDLFEAAGIAVPTTLEEMEAAAAALHNPPELYGYAGRGMRNANVWTFAGINQAFGGHWLDDEGRIDIATPETEAALDYYAHLMRTYAPPGAVGYNWDQVLADFTQGRVAMFHDSASLAAQVENPERSTVVGLTGYAVIPGGVAPTVDGALAISSRARQKDAAYYFLQWATSKEMNLAQIDEGVISARMSAWSDHPSEPLASIPWAQAFFEGLQVGQPALPQINAVTEMRDILGIAIVNVIEGSDSARELATAEREIQAVLDRTEE